MLLPPAEVEGEVDLVVEPPFGFAVPDLVQEGFQLRLQIGGDRL